MLSYVTYSSFLFGCRVCSSSASASKLLRSLIFKVILVRYYFNAVIKIKASILNPSFKLLLIVHTISNTALILNITFLLFNFFFLSCRKICWGSYYRCRNYSSVFKLCTLTLVWWGYSYMCIIYLLYYIKSQTLLSDWILSMQ